MIHCELLYVSVTKYMHEAAMRVTTDSNFVYDDADERCLCIVSQTQGLAFAFIQCVNAGESGTGTELKRYWGALMKKTLRNR
jgi:hypothetical protein